MGLVAKIAIACATAGGCPQRGAITQGFRASFLSKPIPLVPFKTRVKKKNEARGEPAAFNRFGRGDVWLERGPKM